MNYKTIEVSKTCKKLVEYNAGIKPNEKVLVISDFESDALVAQNISSAALNAGAEVAIIIMETRKRPSDSIPNMVFKAMESADIVLWPTKYTLTHTKEVRELRSKGKLRCISMPGVTVDTMISPSVRINWEKMIRTGNKIMKTLEKGKEYRAISKSGTDLIVDLTEVQPEKYEGDSFGFENGIAREPGSFAMFPSGAVTLYFSRPPARRRNPTNGVAVFDASHLFGGLKSPMKWIIEDGWVKKIEGGSEAEQFTEMLKQYHNSLYVEEPIGIGTNPRSRFVPEEVSMTQVKRKAGTLHVGIGGGSSHFDGLMLKPTIEIDGKIIVKEGKIVI